MEHPSQPPKSQPILDNKHPQPFIARASHDLRLRSVTSIFTPHSPTKSSPKSRVEFSQSVDTTHRAHPSRYRTRIFSIFIFCFLFLKKVIIFVYRSICFSASSSFTCHFLFLSLPNFFHFSPQPCL
ncbi:hypothetical protein TorRG33x02_281710 [Trema orientale]|uniref:Transmembrane protein n=1 Tax=Trema orientale TaxID=63057 RepID=A0A2P5CKE1_TREOI|nr:hypothetical protein TorRG33x02_281710 [Trema orientale]